MKREQLINHSMVASLASYCPYDKDFDLPDTNISNLLRIIYNDADGHRRGDIAAYLSEKTSPELRQFIYDNIIGNQVSVPSNQNVSDEILAEFTRDNSESIYDYRNRVAASLERYGNDFKELREKLNSKQDG